MGNLSHTAAWLRSTEMLQLMVAAAMLHVVASKPLDVNVEVTVNGVKIPINLDKAENSARKMTRPLGSLGLWYKKSEENSKTNRQGEFTDWYKNLKGHRGRRSIKV